jgi:ABC-type branched-subunit amino acid transport system substrate-binding protein
MLTTLKTINADAVMTFCGEDDLVMMIKQADMLGIDFNWLSSKKCCSATVIDQLGELAEGLYSLNNALKSKENKVYADYYEEYIKVYPSSETTQKYVDQSYNCMLTVIWAIENGGVDRLSSVTSLLRSVILWAYRALSALTPIPARCSTRNI